MNVTRGRRGDRHLVGRGARSTRGLVMVIAWLLTVAGPVSAQDASPASSGASPAASLAISFDLLYVQTFAGSHLEPSGDTVVVTAARASGQTMYVEGLQERRVGMLPTAEFLERLDASLGVPPYAAVLGLAPDGSEMLVVGQVLGARQLDPQTFEYDLRLVPDEVDIDLAVDAVRLEALTAPLDLQLTYLLFTGVEGCPPWETTC